MDTIEPEIIEEGDEEVQGEEKVQKGEVVKVDTNNIQELLNEISTISKEDITNFNKEKLNDTLLRTSFLLNNMLVRQNLTDLSRVPKVNEFIDILDDDLKTNLDSLSQTNKVKLLKILGDRNKNVMSNISDFHTAVPAHIMALANLNISSDNKNKRNELSDKDMAYHLKEVLMERKGLNQDDIEIEDDNNK